MAFPNLFSLWLFLFSSLLFAVDPDSCSSTLSDPTLPSSEIVRTLASSRNSDFRRWAFQHLKQLPQLEQYNFLLNYIQDPEMIFEVLAAFAHIPSSVLDKRIIKVLGETASSSESAVRAATIKALRGRNDPFSLAAIKYALNVSGKNFKYLNPPKFVWRSFSTTMDDIHDYKRARTLYLIEKAKAELTMKGEVINALRGRHDFAAVNLIDELLEWQLRGPTWCHFGDNPVSDWHPALLDFLLEIKLRSPQETNNAISDLVSRRLSHGGWSHFAEDALRRPTGSFWRVAPSGAGAWMPSAFGPTSRYQLLTAY